MRRILTPAFPALAVSVLVAACGSGSSSSGAKSTASSTTATGMTIVAAASNPTLGRTVLVDAHGLTLYRLSGEGAGKFICTGSCTKLWHPLAASSRAAPSGTVESLGTIKRPDGTLQVTFRGMPLYTFAQDRKPADAKGQGIKDVGTWNAVSTTATTGGAPTPAQTTPSRSYGY